MQHFDAYHKWLGIPPGEQPAHLYRLLGVQLFESDPDVIEAAANQRMAHLRTYQTGPHSAESQRLLSEVARARVCLLSRDQRHAYDASLMERPVFCGDDPILAQAVEVVPPPIVGRRECRPVEQSVVSKQRQSFGARVLAVAVLCGLAGLTAGAAFGILLGVASPDPGLYIVRWGMFFGFIGSMLLGIVGTVSYAAAELLLSRPATPRRTVHNRR